MVGLSWLQSNSGSLKKPVRVRVSLAVSLNLLKLSKVGALDLRNQQATLHSRVQWLFLSLFTFHTSRLRNINTTQHWLKRSTSISYITAEPQQKKPVSILLIYIQNSAKTPAWHSVWRYTFCPLINPSETEINLKYKFISVFNQLDAQNLFHGKFYFMPLHVSSTWCSKTCRGMK